MPAPPAHHRLLADGDGPPVLVKEARGVDAIGRLGAEAAVLRALAHPGVVRLVGHEVEGDIARLSVAWVGPHTLATVVGVPMADAATIVADVADTVADVHRAGLCHGRLTPDHVLLGAHGRPVLTGFAEARALAGPADVRVDTAALGALLTTMVTPSEPEGPIPDRRRRRREDSGRRATLLTLADRAQEGPADEALTPGDLADRIRGALGVPSRPDRRTAVTGRAEPRPTRPASGRHLRLPTVAASRAVVAGALGLAVVTTVGAAAWIGPDERRDGPAAAPTTTPPATTTTDRPATDPTTDPTPEPTSTAPSCPATSGPSVADVDGDGCPEDVTIDGARVTVDGETWVAGRPDDTIVVGDWDCDGVATVAGLRPSSGEIFVFPRWTGSGEDLTVGPAATVDGARSLRSVVRGDGCHDLVAVDADGTPTVVEEAA